jgi:uncharacterized circularly permuted ATP-grasp superfamily protein/uncharacterized alpha-E superfamily protein
MSTRPESRALCGDSVAADESASMPFAGTVPHYQVPPGHFDELRGGEGLPQAHWQSFGALAGRLGPADLDRKQASVARQIHENGVTYNVYAAADGQARPWGLDVLPLLIPARQWDALAAGVKQRARLLNALAADIYGSQRMLAEGLLPAALVFGHPGFLRACHGVQVPNEVYVHQAAFDVARGADGCWWVIGCRTQAPSGTGYALENRLAISRQYPDAFRDMRVRVLAPFFRTLQRMLLESAPCEGDTPRIVLLTPGPYSETYFEHAYLARYLGFLLAEGGDLTVRDDRVYLKTVTGLQRVHAILRRLDDDYCDPLELRSDSTLGIPGLVQAWRAGQVLVANAFGTSVLESPALDGFLPSACERLLGERLLTPSVASWWCGEQAALDDALPQLSHLVLKPTFPDMRLEPVFLGDLDAELRSEWSERLKASPEQFVLQEYLPLSHAPVWQHGRLESRALMLRVFVTADGRGDYEVMPGGLSRIAGGERQIVSSQRGGSSKDAWVLSDAPVEAVTLLPGRLSAEDVARSLRAVSSRSGENLFWLGRYAERAENCARLLRAVLSRLPDPNAFTQKLHRPLLRSCRRHGLLSEAGEGYIGNPHLLERDLIDNMFDRRDAYSLAYNVEQTLRVAGSVRDRLSPDNWRLVNQLFQSCALESRESVALSDALDLCDSAIVSLVAIGGLEMEHMTRDEGWRFLSIGRYIERLLYMGSMTAEVADYANPEEAALLEWLLDSCDSTITFRTRYMRAPEWLAVADLLIFDRRNPRALVFQLSKLAKQVRLLPQADLGALVSELARAFGACRSGVSAEGDLFAGPGSLADFLRYCEVLGCRLSDALSLTYFSHVYESSRSIAVIR